MNDDEIPHGDDVELYVMSTDRFHDKPKTEAGEYMGTPSTSLWMRWNDKEFPVFYHSEYGSWASPMVDFSKNVNENHVSEAFIEAVARLPDDDYNGWTGIEEETWEEMSDSEQFLVHGIRAAITRQERPDDPRWIILRLCQERAGVEVTA